MTLMRVPISSFLRVLALVFASLSAVVIEAQVPMVQPGASSAVRPGTAMLGGDDQPLQVYRARTDEVNVIFTVTDKHNKFVKDLKQQQFKILDNNLPPRQIMTFEAETDMPLRVGLLIDASNSIRDRFVFEQQAATEFLRQVIRPNTDQAFVLAFDEVTDMTQDFTSDLTKLSRGIDVIRPGGGTAMWDAVYHACKDKLMKEREDGNNRTLRKAIILVSDGDDNQSRVTRQEAYDMAQRSGVIIYAISTNLSNILDSGDRNLKLLAEATGGRAFFPAKLHDLTDAFRNIREELRSQYSVSYKPSEFQNGGQYRPIQIIADNKHLRVRAKKGYYVPR
jgi:Ca-activated chloride channel homolog